jgi:hypothetical protein
VNTATRCAAICLLLLPAACASGSPEEFDRRMTAFVGRPEAELVSGLGVPNRTYEAEGRRLLQYEFTRPSASPAVYPSIGLGFGSFGWGSGVGVGTGLGFGGYGAPPQTCAVVFETREGQVQGFNRRGEGCVA